MRFLLDTCVLSELQRPNGNSQVIARVEEIDAECLFISVITLGELTKEVQLLVEGRKKRELTSWVLGLDQRFGDRILTVDQDVALIWGEITARAQQRGVQILASDGLIAATALRHGLHLMTRNTRHFQQSGAMIIDPWRE